MTGIFEYEIDLVVQSLRRGSVCGIARIAGGGGSTLLAESGQRLVSDGLATRTVLVRGRRASRAQPWSALRLDGFVDARPTFVTALDTVLERTQGAVLLIDDADDLDDESAGVLAAAQAARNGPTIWTARKSARGDFLDAGSFVAAMAAAPIVTIDRLSHAQVMRLLHRTSESVLEPDLVTEIYLQSGGDPGIALALEARRHEDSDDRNDEVGILLRRRLAWLSPAARHHLEIIAAASPLPLEAVASQVPPHVLSELEREGFVVVADGPSGVPYLVAVPSVLRDYLTRLAPTALIVDTEAMRASAASAAPELTDLSGNIAPGPVDEQSDARADLVFADLASHYWGSFRSTLLAEWQQHPSADNALRILSLISNAERRTDLPDQIFAGTVRESCSGESLAGLDIAYARTLLARDEIDSARKVVSAGPARGSNPDMSEASRIQLEAEFVGLPVQERKVVATQDPSLIVRRYVEGTRAYFELAAGRANNVTAAGDGWSTYEFLLSYYQLIGLLESGKAAAALKGAISLRRAARRRLYVEPFCAYSHVAARAALAGGNLRLASTLISAALNVAPARGLFRQSRQALYSVAGLIASASFDFDEAHRYADAAESIAAPKLCVPAVSALSVRLDVALRSGDIKLERTVLANLPEIERTGNRALAANLRAARAIGRLGPHSLPDLAVAQTLSDDMAIALSAHALQAHERGDQVGVDEATATLRDLGHTILASRLGGTAGSRSGHGSKRSALTRRERQFALLAGEMTNTEIAQRYVVSVRTVENQLHRAKAKLGARTRVELSDLASHV